MKAAELGITIQRLDTLFDTMRTRFRKLIIRKSGQGQKVYTEREQWIIRSFGFLMDHLLITCNISIDNVPLQQKLKWKTKSQNQMTRIWCPLRMIHHLYKRPLTSGQQQRKPRGKSATATSGLDDDIKEMMRQVAASMTDINAKSQDPKEQYGQSFASKCKLVPSHSWYQFTQQIEEVCVRFMNMNPDQGVVSLTFHELSKIFSWNFCIAEILLLMRISSWNFVRVPKAMLWAHVQSFSLKFSP